MDRGVLTATASAYARAQGWDVDAYTVAALSSEDGVCWVMFQGVEARPGNHFSVGVDEASGQAVRLIAGR